MYIHEQPDWPRLHWNDELLAGLLADVRHRQGRLIGRMGALGFDLRREAVLGTLVDDVVKSSDIEGETLDAGQVRSSVARRLGMDVGGMGRADRDAYYEVLERTQRGTTDVTEWIGWFLACLGRSIDSAGTALAGVLAKARFWERAAGLALNERQRLMLNRLLDGFEGKLTTSKWAKLAKCSQDTALRDITYLVDHGLLARNPGGGRSTSYDLLMDA